ncbi:MAG: hypothetical protein EYC67_03335 [Betaproteobacteria bacterium]|nr:MAG: hypothetical protein EYC67_03335 [Betaproteobacteria bacterium]
MKTPKLLPWYARKAGVSIERAEVLWRKAVREATDETGWVGNAEYWGAAMSHFLRLLDEDEATLCAPRVTPLVRSQRRMLRLPFIAMEDFFTVMRANWQRSARCLHRIA